MKEVRFELRLDEPLRDEAREYCKDQDIAMADWVRKLIKKELNR